MPFLKSEFENNSNIAHNGTHLKIAEQSGSYWVSVPRSAAVWDRVMMGYRGRTAREESGWADDRSEESR